VDLYLLRLDSTDRGITGIWFVDGKPYAFSIERPWKDNAKSISSIPEGKYYVSFREDPTPLTMTYRSKYDFFNWHLEVKDVKDRSGIYIHVANKPEDVEGCLGIAEGCQGFGTHFVPSSTKMYKKFYQLITPEIRRNGKVPLTISSKIL